MDESGERKKIDDDDGLLLMAMALSQRPTLVAQHTKTLFFLDLKLEYKNGKKQKKNNKQPTTTTGAKTKLDRIT